MSPRRAPLVAALAMAGGLATVPAASAHDVTYELRGAGQAWVAFHYQDGSPMAAATFDVFAPGETVLPSTTGLTDAAGAMRLDAVRDGMWRVEVHDAAGHASRARLAVTRGVVSLAGQTLPNWLFVASLLGNVLLGFRLAAGHRRGRHGASSTRPASAARQGSVPT